MPFVVDASITLDWALEERHSTAAAALQRLRADPALAPALWWYEVRNGLVTAERRGRTAADLTATFLQELGQFPVTIDLTPDEAQVMALARRRRLTVYDAAYLELAQRAAVPLATLDAALAAAAQAEGVALVG